MMFEKTKLMKNVCCRHKKKNSERKMADSYDISRNPSDLPRSRGVANVRPGASRQHFLDFENMNAQQDNPLRQLTADSWKSSIK